MDTVSATYDALDRMVEQNKSGTYTQLVYSPTGQRFAFMNGSALSKAYVPLPSGGVAVYTSSGLNNYHHMDWLGSFRLASSPTRTVIANIAYAPFGETYAVTGTATPAFTGMTQDTDANLYDFPAREYGTQGRWPSPDPAGLAAVDFSDPQSWNRYSYVRNSPTNLVDPLGLDSVSPFQKNHHPRRPHPRHAIGCGYYQLSMFGGGGCLDNWNPFLALELLLPGGYTSEGQAWWYCYGPSCLNVLSFGPGYSTGSSSGKARPVCKQPGTKLIDLTNTIGLDLGGSATFDGTSATGSVDLMSSKQTPLAVTANGGLVTTTTGQTHGIPHQSGASVYGAYIGGGAQLTFSNGEPNQLAGPFQVFAFNGGIGPIDFGFQMACSGSVCQYVVSPPGLNWGLGLSATAYTTNTSNAWAVIGPGCKN